MRLAKKKLFSAISFLFEVLEERQLLSWGTFPKVIGQDVAVAKYPSINGSGQVIADLDSGANLSSRELAGKLLPGYDFVNNDSDPSDDQGHGTMTAAVMVANGWTNTGNNRGYSGDGAYYQGVAAGAKVIPLKVVDANMGFNIYNVERALQWVIANQYKYNITGVNMSLDVGYSGYQVISNELQTLWGRGVFIGASSGNGGNSNNILAWPAASPFAMSCGALNPDGSVNWVGSRGSSLDIMAPGSQVPYPARSGESFWLGGQGTSYSAPYGTAAAVVIKSVNPNFSNDQIVSIIHDSGDNVYADGQVYKRLNIANAIALAYQRSGQSAPSTPSTPSTPTAPTPSTPQAPAPTPVVVTPGGSSGPFSGTAIAVPGTVEAENYDKGGEGVAYHDLTSSNDGGSYRNDGVDIDNGVDAERGYSIGHIRAGEWSQYTINASQSGTYNLDLRVASQGPGGTFHVEIDGANKTGSFTIPQTGNDNAWTTITRSGIGLSAGTHTVRLVCESNGAYGPAGNVNWMKFYTGSGSSTPATVPTTQPPASTGSVNVTLAANRYSDQQGISSNSTGIGWLDEGDWVSYKGINFGGGVSTFTANLAVADAFAGKQIQIRVGGPNGRVVGTLTTRGTGSWGNYVAQSCSVSGLTGVQDLYLTFSGGYGIANVTGLKFA